MTDTDTSAGVVDRAVEIVCDEFGYTRNDLTQKAETELRDLTARVQKLEAAQTVVGNWVYPPTHDEPMSSALVARVQEVEAKLATARKDALREAAEKIDCVCAGFQCDSPSSCPRIHVETILTLIDQPPIQSPKSRRKQRKMF